MTRYSKPALVTMSPGTKADLYKKTNAYIIKMHKRLKSGRTSTAAALRFIAGRTKSEMREVHLFCEQN